MHPAPVGRQGWLTYAAPCLWRAPEGSRAAPASAGGGARWSPSTRPATASTPLRPPRPPPPAVPRCEAPGQARAARARPSRAAA
eukprot:scaffold53201_cov78-Phaeocystis_antarctica.AAC.2